MSARRYPHPSSPPGARVFRPVAAYDAKVALQENEVQELRIAAEQLHRVIEEHFEGDKNIVCRVLKGLAWEGICNYAQNAGIDLIILGAQGAPA